MSAYEHLLHSTAQKSVEETKGSYYYDTTAAH